MEYKYLNFEELEEKPKTKQFAVKSKQSGDVLGKISWYGPWRRYCFSANYGVVFDASCLADIQDYLNKLMTDWKGKKEQSNG